MSLHVGDPVLYRGERYLVKRTVDAEGLVVVEDDEGFVILMPVEVLQPIGYRATVDRDGFVRDIEDDEPEYDLNFEGDPTRNGAFGG